jgi:glycosyltransferase involved in cell wall biosynthesis
MRILLISHPPLTAELGAAQVALNLAAALRDRGHNALAWSPAPVADGFGSFRRRQAAAVARFVAEHGPFEVIDTPVTSASRALARRGHLVVRSTQPELLYLLHDHAGHLRRHPGPRAAYHAFATLPAAAGLLAGWRRARLILCLGRLELGWMRRRFPFWRHKLGLWTNCPAPDERDLLTAVRRQRPTAPAGPGSRFLWIGRWTAHKGTRRLLQFLHERLAAFPADTCTLAGCGPDPAGDLPDEWLRAGRVRLVPSFTRAELPALLAGHDAGLFTSEVEGWGLSLNEMLESGLPVYATEAGGVPDLRPFFPGALRPFPPPPRALLEELPGEDLAANGYLATFTWPAVAAAWERQVLAAATMRRA